MAPVSKTSGVCCALVVFWCLFSDSSTFTNPLTVSQNLAGGNKKDAATQKEALYLDDSLGVQTEPAESDYSYSTQRVFIGTVLGLLLGLSTAATNVTPAGAEEVAATAGTPEVAVAAVTPAAAEVAAELKNQDLSLESIAKATTPASQDALVNETEKKVAAGETTLVSGAKQTDVAAAKTANAVTVSLDNSIAPRDNCTTCKIGSGTDAASTGTAALATRGEVSNEAAGVPELSKAPAPEITTPPATTEAPAMMNTKVAMPSQPSDALLKHAIDNAMNSEPDAALPKTAEKESDASAKTAVDKVINAELAKTVTPAIPVAADKEASAVLVATDGVVPKAVTPVAAVEAIPASVASVPAQEKAAAKQMAPSDLVSAQLVPAQLVSAFDAAKIAAQSAVPSAAQVTEVFNSAQAAQQAVKNKILNSAEQAVGVGAAAQAQAASAMSAAKAVLNQ